MKKTALSIVLLSSVAFAEVSFSEYKDICNSDNETVVSVSADNQTEYNAIEAAIATGQLRLLEKVKGKTVKGDSFLAKAYRKHLGEEQLTKDQVHVIETHASGIVTSKLVKEPEFFPNGNLNKRGEPLGKAKVWLKTNCNSYSSYFEFIKRFSF